MPGTRLLKSHRRQLDRAGRPQDLTVQIVYDADNVYFGFVVTDEYHENAANSAWNGDSVQFMIASADRTAQVALYNYALGGIEGALGERDRHARGRARVEPKRSSAANTTTKRTTYEIKLPKASLGLTDLTADAQFGLGMAINDGDRADAGPKGLGRVGCALDRFWQNAVGNRSDDAGHAANDIEPGKEIYTAVPHPQSDRPGWQPLGVDGSSGARRSRSSSIPKGSGTTALGNLRLVRRVQRRNLDRTGRSNLGGADRL